MYFLPLPELKQNTLIFEILNHIFMVSHAYKPHKYKVKEKIDFKSNKNCGKYKGKL